MNLASLSAASSANSSLPADRPPEPSDASSSASFMAALLAHLAPSTVPPPPVSELDGTSAAVSPDAVKVAPAPSFPARREIPEPSVGSPGAQPTPEIGAAAGDGLLTVLAPLPLATAPAYVGEPKGEAEPRPAARIGVRASSVTKPVEPASLVPTVPATMSEEIDGATAMRAEAVDEPSVGPSDLAPPAVAADATASPAPPLQAASSDPIVTAVRGSAAARMPEAAPQMLTSAVVHAVHVGDDRISVALLPKELGRVEVDLVVDDDGRLRASFAVERPETLQMLQRDQRSLAQALTGAGISLADAGLSFSLTDQQGGQRGDGRAWGSPDPARADALREPSALALQPSPGRALGAGLLDLSV